MEQQRERSDDLMVAHDRLHSAIQNVETASLHNVSERIEVLKAERIFFRAIFHAYMLDLLSPRKPIT